MYGLDMKKKLKEADSYIEASFANTPDDWDDIADIYLISTLKKKVYKIQDTSQTYRVINHWCEIGLVDDNRGSKSRGWREFSLADLVWIRIIDELREFGLPLEKIAQVKKSIFSGSLIEIFYERLAKAYRSRCLLIVEKDGSSTLVNENQDTVTKNNHICIDVGALEKEVMEKSASEVVENFTAFSLLDAAEQELLSLIRSGKYENISVLMKDGAMHRFDMKEKVNGRMIDLLNEHEFQDIEVKTENGKVISMKRVIKHIPISRAMEALQATSTHPLNYRKSRG